MSFIHTVYCNVKLFVELGARCRSIVRALSWCDGSSSFIHTVYCNVKLFVELGARCRSIVRALSWCDGSSDRSFMVDPLNYFSFQPVLHDWCNKGHGMCYPICGMAHIKEPLLLIGKSSPCGSSGFPLSLSEWSFTICLMPYKP